MRVRVQAHGYEVAVAPLVAGEVLPVLLHGVGHRVATAAGRFIELLVALAYLLRVRVRVGAYPVRLRVRVRVRLRLRLRVRVRAR